ncbi:MAG: SIS domain-containing protein [Anaerolineae bacterium]|nr:SIS domain-containing protein [Anaerolineae bacterium]
MSTLKKELYEQPTVVARLLEREGENVARITAALRDQFNHVVIAARGTSDNAARYAQYLFGAHNQTQVALATPSLFTLYQRPPQLDDALVIGISQSGQSPDIVSVVAEGRRQGRPTLAIVNDADSPLARAAEHVIPLHAGPELAVAASKTYTASLAVLALFSCGLSGDAAALAQLRDLPARLAETLSGVAPILPRIERYRFMTRCAVIGRGFNYATAFEVALKVKELTRVVAEPYSSADFRHGPIAIVDENFTVLLVAPCGAVAGDLRALVADLQRLKAEQIIISDDESLLEQAHLALPLPADVPEWLTPLIAVLPGQLFAMTLAQVKGADPDRPLGLTKVTETL